MKLCTQLYVKNCPMCAVVSGSGKVWRPPCTMPHSCEMPISDSRDVTMGSTYKTIRANWYVLVFQDFLTKWPCACVFHCQTNRLIVLLRFQLKTLFHFLECQRISFNCLATSCLTACKEHNISHCLSFGNCDTSVYFQLNKICLSMFSRLKRKYFIVLY